MTMPQHKINIQNLIDASKSEEEKEALKVFTEILQDLRDILQNGDNDLQDVQDHFQKTVEYCVLNGRKVRALMLMKAFREMVRIPSEEQLKLVRVIGWCYEMHYSTFKVCDEVIFDRAVDEEGRPCYHKVMDIGIDAYYIECVLYYLIQKYSKDEKLMTMFRKTNRQTVIGQRMFQETMSPQGQADFSVFTPERYDTCVKYRSSGYTFFLPVQFAMYMGGVEDKDSLQHMEDVAVKLGHFQHVKEDYLNCFGSKEVFGKSVSNIALNKICWLIVTALEMANDRQREILKANYGRPNKDCIDRVKAVYSDLDLKVAFRKYEKKAHLELSQEISKMRDDLPKSFLMDAVNNILNWEDTLYFYHD